MPTPAQDPADPAPAVLVVDDEPDIVDSVSELVQRCVPAVRVQGVTSGGEALRWLGQDRCALMVVDYRMPGMDGLELFRRVDALQPQARRILMTAFPDRHLALRAVQEARVDRFLAKPFPAEDLISGVRDSLGVAAALPQPAWSAGRAGNPGL